MNDILITTLIIALCVSGFFLLRKIFFGIIGILSDN